MPRDEKAYHKNFLEYVNFIVEHEVYRGLPIDKNRDGSYRFVTTKQSKIGKERQRWVEQKADELGIEKTIGFASKVMRRIHPTKETVCQICGRSMSIYYHYLNIYAVSFFEDEYELSYDTNTHIVEVWNDLQKYGYSNEEIQRSLFEKCNIECDRVLSREECIAKIEEKCRRGESKFLGPGAMSNFPDRFDGFHSYNRCCRSTEDKGRHKENMDMYNRDRRAYERWSDGNIRAANLYMKDKKRFADSSPDHVGPISLGFVHDPRYLRPMPLGDNITRQNQLTKDDIDLLIEIEQRTGVSAISWYADKIWEYIKANYQSHTDLIESAYKKALQQNMVNFMQMLYLIISRCGEQGKVVLTDSFLKPKYPCFDYNYKFDDNGEITKMTKRRKTERAKFELENYRRVAINSVIDYAEKENRRIKQNLNAVRIQKIEEICNSILSGEDGIKEKIVALMADIQNDTILSIE